MNFHNQYLYSKYFIRGLVLLACLALTLPVMAGWSEKQKITSVPPGVGAKFGNAVAISGNTMVVGAAGHSETPALATAGAAFVYELNGTTWTYKAKLLANDAASSDNFGYSVAISGDTIVVGAYHDDDPPSTGDIGSAYVFVRNGTTWMQQKKLKAGNGMAADEFGNSVGIFGNVIVVGAHQAKVMGFSYAGSAYIFRRSGTAWSTSPQILIPTATLNQTTNGSSVPSEIGGDLFGESVAISGNFIAVGARGNDNPQGAAGAVYVFEQSGGGSYKNIIPSGTNGDNFGNSVALEGNTLVAGAWYAPNLSPTLSDTKHGAAYVFEFNGATWTSQGKLVATGGATGDLFGWSVAVSSNVIAVGAPGDDSAAGSAYVFMRSGSAWTEIQKLVLVPAERKNGDRFGESVALSLGNLVVGAAAKDLKNSQGQSIGQGAAYYFVPDDSIWLVGFGLILLVVLIAIMRGTPIRPWPRRMP